MKRRTASIELLGLLCLTAAAWAGEGTGQAVCETIGPDLVVIGGPAQFGLALHPGIPAGRTAAAAAVAWDFGDASAHSSLQAPSHRYTKAGWFVWSVEARQGDFRCRKTWLIGVHTPGAPVTDGGQTPLAVVQEVVAGLKNAYRKEKLGANLDGSQRYPLRLEFRGASGNEEGCWAQTAEFAVGDGKALDRGLARPALNGVSDKLLGLRLKSGYFLCAGTFTSSGRVVSFPAASVEVTDAVRFGAGSVAIVDGHGSEYDGKQWLKLADDPPAGPGLAEAVAKIGSPAVLAELARSHRSPQVRSAAISSLTDQPLLGEIAVQGQMPRERLDAIQRIDSQPVLLDVVKRGREAPERLAATKRIADQSILSELARSSAEPAVALSALNRVEAVPEILRVLRESPDASVRSAAIERLGRSLDQVTDQKALADIATQATGAEVRRAAIGRVDSQDVIRKVAGSDSDRDVRLAAVERVSDQAVLARLASAERDEKVGLAAVERIGDQSGLAAVASSHSPAAVRLAAVQRIAGEDRLAQVAEESSEASVGVAAVERIKQRSLLEGVAKKSRRAPVWVAAAAAAGLPANPVASLSSGSATAWMAPFVNAIGPAPEAGSSVQVRQRLGEALQRAGWKLAFAPLQAQTGPVRIDEQLESARAHEAQVLLLGTVTDYARKTGNTGTTVGFGLTAVDVLTGRVVYKGSCSRTAGGNTSLYRHNTAVVREFVKNMLKQTRKAAKSRDASAPLVMVIPFAGADPSRQQPNAPAVMRDALETALFDAGYRLAVPPLPDEAFGSDREADARQAGRAGRADIVVLGTVSGQPVVGFKLKAIDVSTGAVSADFSVNGPDALKLGQEAAAEFRKAEKGSAPARKK